ncbi:ATP-binding protein involved in chromosome partitioning [Flavobacterium sp. CG_9.1]|jgi:ATP-binding protein involved in chromosome partitioning|uniref:Mrp/NBP35 family ATP-binding protein n=1 Tax=Flavobacterium sp. CG_9.1 TaxID=2787728 RepID=UPI0018CB6119|nr:Mrp/NBP35 family ATP-binding protein [Flavobacterium sp. CG_9.1]MBG6061925.1 ATP-binding protein involved in chromosome partitioning [Flavobacterium sp. CG_9.1]
MNITKEQVLEALKNVEDPDLKKDLVTLGMIKDLEVEGKNVSFTVVLTTPACPMKELIHKACVNSILHFIDEEANVNVKMTSDVSSRKSGGPLLPNVKNIIGVASGKGGVGKSTVASNLALALVKLGASVGLVDADIYGPSQTIMFDVMDAKPQIKAINGVNKMIPVESFGVKLLSIGFFVDTSQALVWRGPMASKAVVQLFQEAEWGELDYMIIDLPPGTGDIHLSLVGAVPLNGVVIVSTPQFVALADAKKGVGMFQLPSINVPVLGIVENMAYFSPPDEPEKRYYIFGKDGAKKLAEELEVPLLGEIPLVQNICESGDLGRPAVLQENTPQAIAYMEMARKVAQQVSIQNAKAPAQVADVKW